MQITTHDEIQGFCLNYLAKVTGVSREKLDPNSDFASLGLDSATAVALIFELEEQIGIDLAPSLMFEHPSVAKLSEHLRQLVQKEMAS